MPFITRLRLLATTAAIVCTRALINPTALGVGTLCTRGDGNVLLVRTRLGFGWTLPGGGVSRGEPPALAAQRELVEETGHQGGAPPVLFGIYTRRILFATNYVAIYRVEGGEIAFKPGFEIAEARWFPIDALPADVSQAVRRRLAELAGTAPQSPYW